MEKLVLTDKWDKTFPKSDKVRHEKVTFYNRYGITLAADLYAPKDAQGSLAAIAVCGPFGAVKEQASGLYAQQMAERGFLAIAFDPLLHRRERGRTEVRRLPGHQHRGLPGRRRLPLSEAGCGSGKNRHHRYLRLGRNGAECRGSGHQGQSHGGVHDVRHDPRDCQRIF